MALSHEHVRSKILAKNKIYSLTRAELLFNLCYEIPCSISNVVEFSRAGQKYDGMNIISFQTNPRVICRENWKNPSHWEFFIGLVSSTANQAKLCWFWSGLSKLVSREIANGAIFWDVILGWKFNMIFKKPVFHPKIL